MKRLNGFAEYLKALRGLDASDIGYFLKTEASQYMTRPENNPFFFSGQYIFDYHTGCYAGIDRQFAAMAGRSMDYIKDKGLGAKESFWHEPDQLIHNDNIFPANLDYFRTLPVEDHPFYMMECNYRIKQNGQLRNILQQSFFIKSAADGMPLITLGYVSDITHRDNGQRIVHSIHSPKGIVHRQSYFADKITGLKLNDRYIEILRLASGGFDRRQIADATGYGEKRIDNMLSRIYKKLDVHNLIAAVDYARRNELIER